MRARILLPIAALSLMAPKCGKEDITWQIDDLLIETTVGASFPVGLTITPKPGSIVSMEFTFAADSVTCDPNPIAVSATEDEYEETLELGFLCVCSTEGDTDFTVTRTDPTEDLDNANVKNGTIKCAAPVAGGPTAAVGTTYFDTVELYAADGDITEVDLAGYYDAAAVLNQTVTLCGYSSVSELTPGCEESDDGGQTWAPLSGVDGLGDFRDVIRADDGSRVYLTTTGVYVEDSTSTPVQAIALTDPTWLISQTTNHGCLMSTGEGGTYELHRSADCSTDWTSVAATRNLRLFDDVGDTLVAADFWFAEAVYTEDDGVTWQVPTGLPPGDPNTIVAHAGGIYAGYPNALYTSTDGKTFTLVETTNWPGGPMQWSESAQLWFSHTNGLWTSPDGIVWTDVGVPSPVAFIAF